MPTLGSSSDPRWTTRAVARSRAERELMNAPTTVHPPDTAPEEGGTAARHLRGTVHRWLSRVVSLVATLAVVGIAAVALALTAVPAAVHGHALTVLSGSMVPEFSPGAMVVDKPAPAASLRVGDVITYATTDEVSGAPILITHRIVEIQAGPTFITQGDANNSPDSRPVAADQIRGKVWYSVPYVGTTRNFLLAQGAVPILGSVAGLVLAVWLLLYALRPDPAPATETEPDDSEPAGRHRARNGATAAALVGLLATGSQFVPHQPGTYASFSDQQSVQFQITVGSNTPAPEAVFNETPTQDTAESAPPAEETVSNEAPAEE